MKNSPILHGPIWLAALAVLAGWGCQADKDIVARFRGGVVTRSDIEAFDEAWPMALTPVTCLEDLLHQGMDRGLVPHDVGVYFVSHWPQLFIRREEGPPQNALQAPLTDEEIARQQALESICLEQLRDQPEQMAGRDLPQLAAQIHLLFQAMEAGQHRLAPLKIADEELQSFYESHRSDYQEPARVDLRHLFLNSGLYTDRPSRDEPKTVALAEDLFRRLAQGEAFGRLIHRHSNSDTRERGGWILEAEPTALRPEVQQALQQLEPGEISPPIKTRVGIHLVQLIERHARREISFEQARGEIHQLLLAQRRDEVYRTMVAEAAERSPVQVIPQAFSDDTGMAVVLRVGDQSYGLEDIAKELRSLEPTFDELDRGGKAQVITRLGHAALYLQSLQEQPVTHYKALEDRLKAQILTEQFLAARAEQRLAGMLDDHRQLQAFFQQRRDVYQTPWQVRLSLAEIPLPDPIPQDPIGDYRRRQEQVARARQLINQLQKGTPRPSVEGIEIRRWRTQRTPRPLEELSQPLRDAMVAFISSDPDAAELPAVLDRPVEEEEQLLIVRLLELLPARPLSFEESFEKVQSDFVEIKKPEIVRRLRDEILHEAYFRLVAPAKDRS